MTCLGCGDCCQAVALAVPDPDGWLAMHGLASDENGAVVVVVHAACLRYDEETMLCRDYENRPAWCREYLCRNAKKCIDRT